MNDISQDVYWKYTDKLADTLKDRYKETYDLIDSGITTLPIITRAWIVIREQLTYSEYEKSGSRSPR